MEDISDGYVGRMLRLTYLAPAMLEKLIPRVPPAVSIKDLVTASELPWAEQEAVVFGHQLCCKMGGQKAIRGI